MPFRMRPMRIAAGALLLLWLLAGCSIPKEYMIQTMNPMIMDMNLSINRNADVVLVRDALPSNLVLIDGLLTSAPGNKTLLLSAAEAYFGYTLAFVEDNDRERASGLYLKARDYAVRALVGRGPSSPAFLDQPLEEYQAALKGFGRKDVPGLYWTASCWMIWAGLNINRPEVLMAIPRIEAMLLRSVELDEGFYNGGAHAALGAFYSSRARVIGGDPDKAQAHFRRAFEISDSKILIFRYLYAQYYCYQIQDRDLFEKTLKGVIDTPVDHYPDKNFANEVAKLKARALLDKADELF